MKIQHIYWFAYFNMFSPTVRYRAKYPLDLLKEKYGIRNSFVFPSYRPKNLIHFLKVYFSALLFRKNNSLIVIQRVHTNFIYAFALKFLVFIQKENTIYDLDDAEYFDRPVGTINYFMKNCKACSVGSNAVKKYAENFNSSVFVLTSPILRHQITKQKRNSVFTIGWIGDYGGDHRESMFQFLFSAIKEIDFQMKLIILGVRQKKHTEEIKNYFSTSKNISVEIPHDINWQDELSVYNRVKEFDVGVCPLIDNEITRAKSAFKIKQYFSCGVPALGSSVGENARFLENGKNGFICNTTEEFRKSIIRVKEMNDEEYHTLSSNAKNSIHKFDMEHYCSSLINFYSRN